MSNPSLSIPCPKCKAKAGQLCETINGYRTYEHSSRVKAYIAGRGDEQTRRAA